MIVLTDDGVMSVYDGPRLVYRRQMTVYELAELQRSLAGAISRAVAR